MEWMLQQVGQCPTSLRVTAALCLAIVTSLHFYYKIKFSYWRKRGVAGPEPWPLVGNMGALFCSDRLETLANWRREFGKVYGIYEGVRPVLMVADAEVARQICTRDFEFFPGHDTFFFSGKVNNDFVYSMHGERWKQVRRVLSPTFSSGKMRAMFKPMQGCADDLHQAVEEKFDGEHKGGPLIELHDLFGLFSIDTFVTCCYGFKMDRRKSTTLNMLATRNEFVRLALRMFDYSILRALVVLTLNERVSRFFNICLVQESHIRPFVDRIAQIIERRKAVKGSRKCDDYLQILLDAGAPQEQAAAAAAAVAANQEARETLRETRELDKLDCLEAHHTGEPAFEGSWRGEEEAAAAAAGGITAKREPLSEPVILASASLMLASGLETSSSLMTQCTCALAYHKEVQVKLHEEVRKQCTCALAYHKEVQVKLHEEVRKIAGPRGKNGHSFEYDSLISCQYLDAVIAEALRTLPPSFANDRVAGRDYLVEKYNIRVSEGVKIYIQLSDIMINPDYWPEPRRFNPERFMPENRARIVPGSYCPFGAGPRHCLGMRFALTEAKFALAKLIMDYEFEPAPNTSYPLESRVHLGITAIKKPYVRFARRAPS